MSLSEPPIDEVTVFIEFDNKWIIACRSTCIPNRESAAVAFAAVAAAALLLLLLVVVVLSSGDTIDSLSSGHKHTKILWSQRNASCSISPPVPGVFAIDLLTFKVFVYLAHD